MKINAAPTFTNAKIDYVFAGYSDGSIGFIPIGGTLNPAKCPQTQLYVMPSHYDTKAALSVLLAAKLMNKSIYFSVRDDLCHAPENTDVPGKYPVIQRVAIR